MIQHRLGRSFWHAGEPAAQARELCLPLLAGALYRGTIQM